MGVYARLDSPYWWMLIERQGQPALRKSTGIVRDGGSPVQDKEQRRQAQAIYVKALHDAHTALPRKPPQTFRQWATWYESHVVAHHRGAKTEGSMVGRLVAHFGPYQLAVIDAALVREWMTTRATVVSRSTVNRELDLLKAMIRSAVPKYLDATPLGDVRRFRLAESEPRVLSVEEEARLLDVCTIEDKALIVAALDTLLRLSSLVRLEWAQVKLDARVIVPLNAKVTTDAKPISSRLHAALTALPRADRYVFAGLHGGIGETAAKNKAIRRFADLCHAAKIDHGRARDGLTFHCLRHTGATRALQRGASLRTVMALGGWKNAATVLRYLHAADSDVIAAAESIGNHVTEA